MRQGFSLVELSIVLVILGLLTGGILSGQSLIRAAELRSVTTDYNRYTAAVKTFRDKYFAIPGDMANATSFWGSSSGVSGCTSNAGGAITSPGTCDGNGDGALSSSGSASGSVEVFQFWRQLALAGLVEGSYSGVGGTAASSQAVIGSNVPRSRISNAGWSVINYGIRASDPYLFDGNYGNSFVLGTAQPTWVTTGLVFKPEDVWNIDSKIDDGKPGSGMMVAFPWNSTGNCTDATSSASTGANYALSASGINCAPFFRNNF